MYFILNFVLLLQLQLIYFLAVGAAALKKHVSVTYFFFMLQLQFYSRIVTLLLYIVADAVAVLIKPHAT